MIIGARPMSCKVGYDLGKEVVWNTYCEVARVDGEAVDGIH